MSHPDPENEIKLSELIASMFSFRGRIGRIKFVLGHLLIFSFAGMAMLIAAGVPGLYLLYKQTDIFFLYVTAVSFVLFCITHIAILTLYVRRFHDINLTGFFAILYIIALAVLIGFSQSWPQDKIIPASLYDPAFWSLAVPVLIFLMLALLPGSPEANKYGERT